MIAVAQDIQGEARVAPIVEERGIRFPVLIDRASRLGDLIGFKIVPSGVFLDERGVVRYRHTDDFDIGDPRVRITVETFLAGGTVEAPDKDQKMSSDALELFRRGVDEYAQGETERAVATWREALALDPDNFVIRSQIWATEHPEHFYPVVDREWQSLQLLKEGYDKPLP